MRVLLTDGSGLTAKQAAIRLHEAGHEVHALSPDPLCLCRFTRHVRRLHRTPPFFVDPLAWFETALAVYRHEECELLLPTQEQAAVLAAFPARLVAAGVATAVPPFRAIAAVQDKVSAHRTLVRLGQCRKLRAQRSWVERHPRSRREGTDARCPVITSAASAWAAAQGPALAHSY